MLEKLEEVLSARMPHRRALEEKAVDQPAPRAGWKMGAVRIVRMPSSLSMRTFRPIIVGILSDELEQRRLIAELYLLPGLVNVHDLVGHLEQRGFAVDVDVMGFACFAPAAIEQHLDGGDARHRRHVFIAHDAGEHPGSLA